MKTKEIEKHNGDKFISDLKSVRDVVVWVPMTRQYFTIKKWEVLREAERGRVHYSFTNDVFVNRRRVMVIY